MKMNKRRYELTDEEWAKIEPFFSVRKDGTLSEGRITILEQPLTG